MASSEFDDDIYQKLVGLDRLIKKLDKDIRQCQKTVEEDQRMLQDQPEDEKHDTMQSIVYYKRLEEEYQIKRKAIQELLHKLENKYWGKGFHYHWEEEAHNNMELTVGEQINLLLGGNALDDGLDDALDDGLDKVNLQLHF